MRYIPKDILTASRNPVADGAARILLGTCGARVLNRIVRPVLCVSRDFNVLRLLTDEGLLVSDSPKTPVRLAFSAATAPYWLPDLITR